MASFVVYDLIFFGLFLIWLIIFLYRRKENLERHGITFIYKTKLGIKLMDKLVRQHRKLLNVLQYFILASGYILMVAIIFFLGESVYVYLKFPITEIIKAPPIAPIIPYFPKLFGLEDFFPPLHFTYFIIAVGIGGILHELSHGIFARLHKLKVKSTGFLFFGPIPGAFVEPDEEKMKKKKKIQQLSILGAGTFANLVIAIIIAAIIWIFFLAAFVPAGIGFNTYALKVAEINQVQIPDGFSLEQDFVEVKFDDETFIVKPKVLQKTLDDENPNLIIYYDAPAIRAGLTGAIMEVGGTKVTNYEELVAAIDSHSPGEQVKIKTAVRNGFFDITPEFKELDLKFGDREGKAYLGIGIGQNGGTTAITREIALLLFSGAGTLNPGRYYESSLGNFGWFIYFLLWWTFFINVLLAMFNMLPLGPLDGGRFLQLSVAGITRSEKVGNGFYKFATWAILIALAAMMVKWGMSFF